VVGARVVVGRCVVGAAVKMTGDVKDLSNSMSVTLPLANTLSLVLSTLRASFTPRIDGLYTM
jgi:hypothetical protein